MIKRQQKFSVVIVEQVVELHSLLACRERMNNIMMLIDDIIKGLLSQGWKVVGGGSHIAWYEKEGGIIKVMWRTNCKDEAGQMIKVCYSAPSEEPNK